MKIAYISGIKYQLVTDYSGKTSVRPDFEIHTEYIDLSIDGTIYIRHGYCWDGASRFPDDKHIMKPSLVHDALADLCRQGYLDCAKHLTEINKTLASMCLENGVPKEFCDCIFLAVEEISNKNWAKYGTDGGRVLHFAP